MLRSGREFLESIQDGRVVYIGSERVDNVTTHPAFQNAAKSLANLYDLKAAPEHRDIATYVDESGNRQSSYYLQPRSKDDLRKRTRVHELIADSTYWNVWPIAGPCLVVCDGNGDAIRYLRSKGRKIWSEY